MTWDELLASRHLQRHKARRTEIDALRALVARDLRDAELAGLSHDRRFAIAYNAAYLLATIVLACAGYRARHGAHHRTTFQALPLAMGSQTAELASYLQTCRRKRNKVNYDLASEASEVEARELLQRTLRFRDEVEAWITAHHDQYAS
jgi:hypothetical protein